MPPHRTDDFLFSCSLSSSFKQLCLSARSKQFPLIHWKILFFHPTAKSQFMPSSFMHLCHCFPTGSISHHQPHLCFGIFFPIKDSSLLSVSSLLWKATTHLKHSCQDQANRQPSPYYLHAPFNQGATGKQANYLQPPLSLFSPVFNYSI